MVCQPSIGDGAHFLYFWIVKSRDSCFRAQSVISTTTTTMETTVVDMGKLSLPSLEAHSSTVAGNQPLMYVGAIGPPIKDSLEATLATETLLTGEEATIAAAAAEAIALAKAAVKVAKDAALMVGGFPSAKSDAGHLDFPSEADILRLERARLSEMGQADEIGWPVGLEVVRDEEHYAQGPIKDSDNLNPTDEDLVLLQMQLSKNVAVRSGRQTERQARRAKAGEKIAANVVSVKSCSSSRKKRAALQDVDYSDPLRYLRGTTSNSRLLTTTEELELSEGIQDLLKLERLRDEIAERCGGEPTFAQWAAAAGVDQKTLRKRLNYGIFCKDKMIKSNIRLVISIAKNYQGAGLNLQDLVQEGCRGLVRGAEKFDASKGFKFSTYAHWWIKQAVRKSLSDQSRTIRLPSLNQNDKLLVLNLNIPSSPASTTKKKEEEEEEEQISLFHMVEATYRVKEARKQLYSETGRHPDNEEVAEAAGLSMKRLTAVLLTPKAPRSLDQKTGINQDLKLSEVIADPNAETSEDLLIKQFMKQDLEKVLDSINPREKQVIRWRFGLEDGRMKTLQEIGELMGVSRERIRQIESCAFRKLKNKKRTKHLQQYLVS
ncbi:RNA polymerase sigma factor sigB isoform X2 [Macadamia integrifolia]|uniref:RNA polymerase sigma factor sigB isoform X2 n=1 Tax=Macadamia integrifolia TaxID=60698 RepID=UPI001C4F71D1|nr:RNA polymerase sigma factor sigB isoform X2 [Macadamia integrifolia]